MNHITLLDRERYAIAHEDIVHIGMPELCRTGLSETWLFKACGHRHWLALADAHGLSEPDFRDDKGQRLYPAFTQVVLDDARLDIVEEGDDLTFACTLKRLGRNRFRSRFEISVDGATVASLCMETAFVRRTICGDNQSAARGLVASPCRLPPPLTPAASFRAATWERHGQFARAERRTIAEITIDPTPQEDFNGADFLYFASFQAILDRGEWGLFRHAEPLLTTTRRNIVFTGNIEVGDRIHLRVCGLLRKSDALSHWIEMTRESDGALIGLAFTDRRPSSRASRDTLV